MKKVEFIEMVQDIISGGVVTDDNRGKYHPEIIASVIDIMMEDVIGVHIKEIRSHNSDFDAITTTICEESVYDKKRCEHYVSVTKKYMSLPYNSGIRLITANTPDGQENIVIVSKSSMINSQGVEAFDMTSSCYIEGGKVFFKEKYAPSFNITIIPKFRELDDEDEVNIYQGRGKELIVSNLDILKGLLRQTEKYNNNVADQ